MKSVVLMMVYAVVLMFGGYIAFSLAPAGSSKLTALLVPFIAAGLMVVAAVLVSRAKKNPGLARIGVLLGVALPILFGAAFAQRALKSSAASADFRSDRIAFDELVKNGEQEGTIEGLRSFRQFQLYQVKYDTPEKAAETPFDDFKNTRAGKKVKTYDTAYLAAVLWGLCGSSLLALVAIASTKPTIESRPDEDTNEE